MEFETTGRLLPKWLMQCLPYLLILLPILLGFYFVHAYGANMAWGDQWDGMLPLFEKWFAGTLNFGDFWAQHNEHRHFLPRMLMFVLGLLTKWNTVAEMYVIEVLFATILTMLLCVFHRECPSQSRLWLMVPIAWIVFSVRQYQNMLWGWQIGFLLTPAAAIAAFLCLYLLKNPRRAALKYVGALLSATVATFSAAQGLLVWPVGVLLLVLLPMVKRSKIALVLVWVLVGMTEWLAYFWGYVKPAGHPNLAFSCEYFATIVGGALFPAVIEATTAGGMILILSAMAVITVLLLNRGARHSFWLAVIAWGLLVQAQITVARSGFGTGYALSSRYATFSILVLIGTYGILSLLIAVKPSLPIVAMWGALFSLIVLGLILSLVEGQREGRQSRQDMEYLAFAFCTGESQPDEALERSAGPRAPALRRGAEFLKQHQWNIFASSDVCERYATPSTILQVLPFPTRGALEQFALNKETGMVTAVGWALDANGSDLAEGVFLEIDGVLYPAYYGIPRDDVVQPSMGDRLRQSGFMRTFSPRQFSKGRHHLILKILNGGRTAFFKPADPIEFNVEE